MKRGFQRAGRQPTKLEIDCGVIAHFIRNDEMPKAIDYCMEQGIDEKTFADIVAKIEKEQNHKEYYAVVCTYKDGSRIICKGNRGASFNEEAIDKNMLYTSFATALKGKRAYEKQDSYLAEEYDIVKIEL